MPKRRLTRDDSQEPSWDPADENQSVVESAEANPQATKPRHRGDLVFYEEPEQGDQEVDREHGTARTIFAHFDASDYTAAQAEAELSEPIGDATQDARPEGESSLDKPAKEADIIEAPSQEPLIEDQEEVAVSEAAVEVPKKRGKPNPREAEIQETIVRYEAGNEEAVAFAYESAEKAKTSYTNIYTAFKNRGFKVTIAQDGSNLLARIIGKAAKGKKGTKKSATRRKPGRPAKATGAKRGPGRPPKTAARSTAASGATVLVRVRKGRGWSYVECADKAAAEAALYALDSSGSAYEVYERKAVQVKKTVEGW